LEFPPFLALPLPVSVLPVLVVPELSRLVVAALLASYFPTLSPSSAKDAHWLIRSAAGVRNTVVSRVKARQEVYGRGVRER
jgi:hypothetical protein